MWLQLDESTYLVMKYDTIHLVNNEGELYIIISRTNSQLYLLSVTGLRRLCLGRYILNPVNDNTTLRI